MRYLILIADIDEFNPCRESLGDIVKKEYKIKHMPAFDFTYNNHECTAVCFGIGKVNAALGAALALNYDEFDGVINTGWSGAVSGVHKGDIVVSDSCVECDFDLTAIGYPLGKKPQEVYVYEADKTLLEAALKVEGMKTAACGCGDLFLADKDKKNLFKETFNINEFDMETGAEASVCHDAGVPFLAIRQISDTADDTAADSYRELNDAQPVDLTLIIKKIIELL